MFKGCFNVGPCKTVMPYTLSRPYKLSQHWPFDLCSMSLDLHCSVEIFEIAIGLHFTDLSDGRAFQWARSLHFSVWKENIDGEAFFNKKLEAFFLKKNPIRTEKVTSVRSRVTWVKLAGICRRLDDRRGWAACASLASRNFARWKLSIHDRKSFQAALQTHNNHVTFCLAPVGTQHVLRLASRSWRKNSACALGFSRSDPERSRLEVYVHPVRDLFLYSKIWSVETLWTFPQTISFVFKGFEKGLACVQIKRTSTFQTKCSQKCKGHAIYRIVTVYRVWHMQNTG